MENAILFTQLNDFVFCPISIFFHSLCGNQSTETYQRKEQIMGTHVHSKIDNKEYSSSSHILQGMMCYCEKYNLIGKIDLYDIDKGLLTERKRKIKVVYDGYVFQLYAQYFSLVEMGYDVNQIRLYSYDDNKIYRQLLPSDNPVMLGKFEQIITDINNFAFDQFEQTNAEKCMNCIYEPVCDRSKL